MIGLGCADKMNIKTISFDEKSNAVTISGPFDAEKVYNKLCCEAGRVIHEMDIKGKEKAKDGGSGGGDKPKAAAKGGEKDAAGKPEKAKEGKGEKEGGKAEKKEEKKEDKKEGKGDKKEAKPDKAEKGGKDEKAEAKKVKFDLEDAPPAGDAKPGKPMAMSKADLGPLLEKMMAAKAGPEAPRGEPIAPAPAMAPGAAQGVAVPSIWPAPAGSVAGYGYNPSYEASAYYGGGGGYGGYGCGCGGYNGYCRCGKPAAPGGYYGVPVYDSQGWYYGGGAGARQPYYGHQQQPCYEDPNAGCSVM